MTTAATAHPYKLTPERQADIVRWLSGGCYIETAAAAAGIERSALFRWMARGREQRERHVRGVYRAFLDAVEAAMAKHEGALVATIAKASREQWQAAAWLLERRLPERYARTERHEVTGRDGGPVEHSIADRDDIAARLARALAGDGTGEGSPSGGDHD